MEDIVDGRNVMQGNKDEYHQLELIEFQIILEIYFAVQSSLSIQIG